MTICVFLHYEVLRLFTRPSRHHRAHSRLSVVGVILTLLAAHIAEIWVFGIGYQLLLMAPGTGELTSVAGNHLLEKVYFSAVCYSTLGFGDIVPAGPIRFLVGTEGMTGLMLIAWSASYTYLQMEKFWQA